MRIELTSASKKFGRQIIFKDLNYQFNSGESYAVLGGNGSGKSTLLSILYGSHSLSTGDISHQSVQNSKLSPLEAAQKASFSGPYFELIEELQAIEFLEFYQKFKSFKSGESPKSILERAYLLDSKNKAIKHYSSGMKQRLRLVLALYSNTEIVYLDEPCSNLDQEGVAWYQQLVEDLIKNRTLVIGSNYSQDEMGFCENLIELSAFK